MQMVHSVTHCTHFIKASFTFKMSRSLHGTRVNLILFTPIRKQRLSCDDLYEADRCSIALFWGTLYHKSVKLENKCGECGRKCMHAYKIVRSSLRRCPWNLQSLKTHMWIITVRDFTQIEINIYETRTEFNLRSGVKYGVYCSDCHRTYDHWAASRGNFLYRILSKSLKKIWKLWLKKFKSVSIIYFPLSWCLRNSLQFYSSL
jgi:hypothetical protein